MTSEYTQDFEACIEGIFSILSKNDECYLRMAYQVILEREIDPKGLTGWLNQLKEGLKRPSLVKMLAESTEFQQRYRQFLLEYKEPSQTLEGRKVLVDMKGFKIYAMDNDFAVGQGIIRTKSYEPHVTDAIIGHLKLGHTFLDIGANIGYYTLMAANIVGSSGKVIGFEPNISNQQLLYSSIVENQFKNITVYPFAASDSTKIVSLVTAGSNGWLVNLLNGASENQLVQSVAIDELLQLEKQINVIKLDIEGHEPFALQGMDRTIKKHRPIIFTEFHPYAVGEGYLKQLTQYNYRLFIIEEVGKILEAPDTIFVMDFWKKLAQKLNFDRIHLDLMAIPL